MLEQHASDVAPKQWPLKAVLRSRRVFQLEVQIPLTSLHELSSIVCGERIKLLGTFGGAKVDVRDLIYQGKNDAHDVLLTGELSSESLPGQFTVFMQSREES